MPTKRDVEQQRDEMRARLEEMYDQLAEALGYDDEDDDDDEDDEEDDPPA
jgi:hypothetical protein